MGSKLIVFVVLGVASLLLHSSKATDYEVGDSTGWKAPSDTSFYSTWASGKNFTVGDTLKFTFTTGVHDVATVSKSDYDSCNINGQSNVSKTGPTTITLSAPGTLYYFCTFSDHCSRGQKLSITVVASSTPSPPSPHHPPPPPLPPTIHPLHPLTTRYTAYNFSSSPPPPPSPSASSSLVATLVLVFMSIAIRKNRVHKNRAKTGAATFSNTLSMARGYGMALLAAISVAYLIHSSSAQTTYTVGNTTGWIIPQTDPALYSTWAANKAFKVGDILIFNFGANSHDVATVTKTNYDACNASNPLSLLSTPPVRITINASGEHYYFCSIPGHCSAGQKLMINVSDASSSPAPQPSATPAPQPSTPTPSSSPSPAPATSPPASTPAPATSPPASTPAPATSPPASTPAPATSPPAPTPASATPPPAPTPAPGTPTTTTTVAPPPNSAASLGFAGFTTFLSIFVALCY
uniref:Phytocyanin domain-containing protein n=1 Tax=Salix viminalis TaxID=40686 RepID=A0A6N2N111_SALVM